MDISFKDYYTILGVSPAADTDTIKSAFRQKAKETHPDRTKQNSYAQFVLIREAYDILTNPSQRASYDIVWNKYHVKSEPEMTSLFDAFGPPDDRYAQEWEYFVLHPEDYLSRFESTLALIKASLKSIVISVCIPVIVMMSILLGVTIAMVTLFVFAIGITSYSSLIAGTIITLLMVKRFVEILQELFTRYSEIFARWIVKQLKGIPMAIGKWVLYGTFSFIFILLVIYAAAVVVSICSLSSFVYFRIFVVAAGVVAVAVISLSLYCAFTVFTKALLHYPKIRYTKIKVKNNYLLESKRLLQ
ncbi:MAG TPA: J domain-containing protein [Spirochaetota bacterium]|nr:J domain-containing protein [Spirochaetota bacterium]